MKKRLDILLVERGITDSRTKAAALIMAGKVHGADKILDKPGQAFEEDIELTVTQGSKYVSRGGDKLESVAAKLGLDFAGKVVLDIGSSTGGFTDYAFQNGAVKVYCVDVGTNQLDYKLRQDKRVVVMEKTDIRSLEFLPEQVDIITIDVSYISLTKVLPEALKFLKPEGVIVAMAKPQFEAGKEIADRFRGVIKDEKVRKQVLSELELQIKDEFQIIASADSGLPGKEGNIERFYKLQPKR